MSNINIKYFIVVFLLFLFPSFLANAQVTSIGKEFWFGYMDNIISGSYGGILIQIEAKEPAKGKIFLTRMATIDENKGDGDLVVEFDLNSGENFTYHIDRSYADDTRGNPINKGSGYRPGYRSTGYGIKVYSSGDISVYAFQQSKGSADATIVLPFISLGRDYLITSYFEVSEGMDFRGENFNDNNHSQFLVTAPKENTQIEITPSAKTIDGKNANEPFVIELDSMECYQLQSREDLTGSRIRVLDDGSGICKKVAVFAGNKLASVGGCGPGNDHLFQQISPVKSWGREFIHIPLKGRSSGELVRILASEDDTQITFDGTPFANLNKGEYATFDFGPDEIRTIRGNHPIDVTVFSKSQSCNDEDEDLFQKKLGDPFMISYNSNRQRLRRANFEVFNISSMVNSYVTVIVPTSAVHETFLDGNNIASEFQVVPSSPEFSFAQKKVSRSTHTLENPSGFIAYVYAHGNSESYGYVVGGIQDDPRFEVFSNYSFNVNGNPVACLDQDGLWTIEPEDPRYTYFLWDFGDNTDPMEGNEITHVYNYPGTYRINIKAGISPNSCEEMEEIVVEVEVKEPIGAIEGPAIVCPNESGIIYSLKDKKNVGSVLWEIDGGEILNSDNHQVKVKWGDSNENALVTAIPFTQERCPGIPIAYEVKINTVLEPASPTGEDTVSCFDPSQVYLYEVAETLPSRTFHWEIENGTIVSGLNHSSVEVNWDSPGKVGKIWYKEESLNTEYCAGFSDTLHVVVNSPLSADSFISDMVCGEDRSGQIEIKISGGTPPFDLDWGHNQVLNEEIAKYLTEGEYAVTVRDQLGCEISLEGMEVEKIEKMEVSLLSKENLSCYLANDGMAKFKISGGTGPFTLDSELGIIEGDVLTFDGLQAGNYNVNLTDRNNCQLSYDFEISSPDPINVDIEVFQRSCPGESFGELLAVPSGGNGPYTFRWDYENMEGSRIEGVPSGQYAVTVWDQNACMGIESIDLKDMVPQVRMPTGFRPESGGVNKYFLPVSNCSITFTLLIYNKWGELIYKGNSGWDGKVGGKKVPPGSYSYFVKYKYSLQDEIKDEFIRGSFVLIR